MTIRIFKYLLFVVFINISNISYSETYQAFVVGVIDGDTVDVIDQNNTNIRIRLSQIDAPEKKQAFGNKSQKTLSNLIFKKIVIINVDGNDKYGRILGTIYHNDLNINKEMVKLGMAWAYRYFVKDNEYLILESNAKEKRIGLWVDKNPIEPWKFRRNKEKTNE